MLHAGLLPTSLAWMGWFAGCDVDSFHLMQLLSYLLLVLLILFLRRSRLGVLLPVFSLVVSLLLREILLLLFPCPLSIRLLRPRVCLLTLFVLLRRIRTTRTDRSL